MGDFPLDTLNNAMQKCGVRPNYEIIQMKNAKFSVLLTCPITSEGPSLIVESSAVSKKEAKREAARLFIYKYFTIEKDDSGFIPLEFITLTNNIPIPDRMIVLEIICLTRVFAGADYVQVGGTGTLQSPCFIIKCRVSYLRSGGKGESQAAAQSDAAVKMIQLLMDVESVYQMIKVKYSSPMNMTDDAQTVSSKDSSGDSPAASICERKTMVDTNKSLSSRLLRARSTKVSANPVRIRNKSLNPVNTENTKASNGESVDKQLISKTSCTSSNNMTIRNVDGIVLGSNSNGVCQPLTRLQLNSRIGRIDKIAEGYEKQLYDLLLEIVLCGSESLEKSISILSQEYNVVLNRFSPPMISQGDHECKDRSIRIALLMQMLIEFKKNMEYTFMNSDLQKN